MEMPDQEFRAGVKERHGFAEWAGRMEGEPGAPRQDVRLPDDPVEGWSIERTQDLSAMMGVPAARYVFARTESRGRERVMVKVCAYASIADAHEGLIDILASSMAPSLPPCADVGIRAGEVCFGSHGDVQTGAMFARHNVVVHLQSIGQTAVSVAALASVIDELFR